MVYLRIDDSLEKSLKLFILHSSYKGKQDTQDMRYNSFFTIIFRYRIRQPNNNDEREKYDACREMEIKVAFSASDSFFTQIHCCYCWNVRFVFLLFVSSHRRRNCYICQDAIVMHNGVIYVNIMFSIINSPTNWHAQSNNETVQTSEPKPKERKANRKKHTL